MVIGSDVVLVDFDLAWCRSINSYCLSPSGDVGWTAIVTGVGVTSASVSLGVASAV